VARTEGDPQPGDIVDVVTGRGEFLARGYFNPRSQIVVRILTWRDEPIDEDWWRGRLRRAIAARSLRSGRFREQESYRVVNAESDYLPGLIVDRYGDFLVIQALTLFIDGHKALLARLLVEAFERAGIPTRGVYERSDVDVRHKEGLKQTKGVLLGDAPPPLIAVAHGERRGLVDVYNGHKTGTYLDQLQNQVALGAFLDEQGLQRPDAALLNLFSYTGSFGLYSSGHVVNVDASHEVLELAEQIYGQNGFPEAQVEFIQADVFDYLRDQRDEATRYDLVILDPPKFASSAGQVERAARGYKDINLNAFHLVRSGGFLLTFSCSGAITADLFQKIVFGALADSGREAQIVRTLRAGDDHPVALTFPEGEYLKGLLLRVY
jgi:23S rRNA (cytosine1962-C5)-methyltransferase